MHRQLPDSSSARPPKPAPAIPHSFLRSPVTIQAIPFLIQRTLYDVWIASRRWACIACKIARVRVTDYELDAITRQENRPHPRRLTGDIWLKSNIVGLIPITRSFAVHLLVDLPSHRQRQLRLPFSGVARTAFASGMPGITVLIHRPHVPTSTTDSCSVRPRNRECVDVPRRIIHRTRVTTAQLDSLRRLDRRRLIGMQASTSREKHQQHRHHTTKSIRFHSSTLYILFKPSTSRNNCFFRGHDVAD